MSEKKKFKRSDFSGTSTKKIAEETKIEDETLFSGKGGNGEGDNYIKLEDGINKMRVFPKHAGEKSFYHKKVVHWVDFNKEDGGTSRRPVFNAVHHGGEKFKEDILDVYLKLLEKKLKKMSKQKAKEITADISGQNSTLVSKTSWALYANSITKKGGEEVNTFGIFEFGKSIRNGIVDASVIEDEDEAIETDPFSDPDSGQLLIVKKDSSAKDPSKYYKVSVSKGVRVLTDEELEEFSEVKSLTEKYGDVYDRKEFDKALEGIEIFDTKHELGIFEDEKFIDAVQYQNEVLDSTEESGEDTKKSKKSKKSDEEEEEEETPKKKDKKSKKSKVKDEEPEEEEEEEETEEEEEEETPKKKDKKDKKDKKKKKKKK